MRPVYDLPTIFVCENNLYMEYTSIGTGDARVRIRQPTGPRPTAIPARSSTGMTQMLCI